MPDREGAPASDESPPEGEKEQAQDDDEDDEKIVEGDPTGRYGRYDIVLGKGAFKTVFKAFDKVDGIEVAWNQVKVQDVFQSQEDVERLYAEVHLLKTLKHKNIIKFYNSWVDERTKNVNFITEIFTSGTLRQYRKRHKHCDIKAVKNWSRQILRGLLYLHSHDPPIIHRDLKCDNIFVNGNQGEVKIGDLGLAAILHKSSAHSVIGTPEFMAPELYEEEYNELVDIYAFGMCVLEMVTLEYPYSECTNAAQIYKKVIAGKKPAALEKVRDPEVRAFVEKCLASASHRLPARELLKDPFLAEPDRVSADGGAAAVPGMSRSESRQDVLDGSCRSSPEKRDGGAKSAAAMAAPAPPPSSWVGVQAQLPLTEHVNGMIAPPGLPSVLSSLSLNDSYAHEHGGGVRPGSGAGFEAREGVGGCGKEEEDDGSGERLRLSRDFKVKGKLVVEDSDTVYLRLRIADSEHIRSIHFPFSLQNDSAFSVASEMVQELSLTDQDVTNIAEMIDKEILALVPDWKPGLSLDESEEGSQLAEGDEGDDQAAGRLEGDLEEGVEQKEKEVGGDEEEEEEEKEEEEEGGG